MSMLRYSKRSFLREVVFWAYAAVVSVPLYFLVTLSLKSPSEAVANPYSIPRQPQFTNFTEAWSQGGIGSTTFGGALVNSVVVTTAVIVLLVVLGSPAAYAIARRTSHLSRGMFALFLIGMILPAQLGLIPLFVSFSDAGLTGSMPGLILIYVAMLLPLAVLLYAGFFRALPVDYEEAAMLDGAPPVQVFARIVLPLMRPVTATVAILAGLLVWNDFFTPLIFVGGSSSSTLPVVIYSFVGAYAAQWNLVFAGITIALAPVLIVYVLTQKYLIRGFGSGVRG